MLLRGGEVCSERCWSHVVCVVEEGVVGAYVELLLLLEDGYVF